MSLLAAATPRTASIIPVTACSAVSRYDVQEAIGSSVGKGSEEGGTNQTTCNYAGTNGIVTITIHRLDEPVSLQAQQRDLRSAFPNAGFQDASVQGAAGFYMHLPKAGTQLHLLHSARKYVLVSILGFGEGAGMAQAAESIARRVLNSL